MKKPRFDVATAVATYLREDVADVRRDRRYQPTRTPCPVYTVDNRYLTATSGPRQPKEDARYKWRRVDSAVVGAFGWRIWEDVSDHPGEE